MGPVTQLPMVPGARERYFKRERKERTILPCPPETLGSNLPVFSFSPRRPVIAVFPSTLGAFNLKGGSLVEPLCHSETVRLLPK